MTIDLGSVITAAGLLVAGSLLTIGQDALRKKWASETDRQRRQEERQEAAAESLYLVLDQIEEGFRHVREPGEEPSDLNVWLSEFRRHAAVLKNQKVRELLERIASVVYTTEAVAFMSAESPRTAVMKVCTLGRQALGQLLRGDRIEVDESPLKKFEAALAELEQYWEEAERAHMDDMAAQRAANKAQS